VKLAVFDLDGTLVDSRRDLADSANALLRESGSAPLPEDAIGRMVGDGAAVLVARVFEAAGRERPADALDRFLALYDERLLHHTRPYPLMASVLAELGRRARLAVLTNKPIEATRRVLAGLDLARFFEPGSVVGGDGPFPRKPDPAGLRHLITQASVTAAETTMIGDSIIDWRTAKHASTGVCLARYGFGFEGFPIDQLEGQELMADTPSQLLELL
jgi:phosphoglycolate phosphatase